MSHSIWTLEITSGNKYLFCLVSDPEHRYSVLQYDISSRELIKNYSGLRENGYVKAEGIFSIVTTFDSKYLIIGHKDGFVAQVCIESQKVIKQYSNGVKQEISSMAMLKNDEYVMLGYSNGFIKKVSINNNECLQSYGPIYGNGGFAEDIGAIHMGLDDKSFFVYSIDVELVGHGGGVTILDYCVAFKEINLENGETIKDYGEIACNNFGSTQIVCVSKDRQHIFTSSFKQAMKLYSARNGSLIGSYDNIFQEIGSICD